MRSRPILRYLLAATLLILAALHPDTLATLARLGAGAVLAIVTGIAQAATAQPEAALLTAGALYITHQIRTHRPARARAHP
jgi:hypothetical protein